jgi:phosphopantothenoylcysteine decarboxylase/phosphopantothenate--cysteine ligase
MGILAGKHVVLGVTGGIAAYKSAELVRRLREGGAEVRVVMTRAAREFITPLTLQALSDRPVHTDLLDPAQEAAMSHIELARWADMIVVAPASANFLARLAHGAADDLLSTLCLAADIPILVAPAMNRVMWESPATRANVKTLEDRGVQMLGPAEGGQACGETGPGRMLEPPQIIGLLEERFATGVLAGVNVLVTAGPTREAIDPVRFISNRSSGRMGYAIARAAQEAGAAVTLVTGPVAIAPPERVRCVRVTSAEEMLGAVLRDVDGADILVAAAAVADYRPSAPVPRKIKKQAPGLALELERTPDILAEVARLERRPFTVGFAAETERLRENALKKLRAKGLDMIAANEVGGELGFDSEENVLEVLWRDGGVALPRASKEKLARELVRLVAERFHAKNTNQAHRSETGG